MTKKEEDKTIFIMQGISSHVNQHIAYMYATHA